MGHYVVHARLIQGEIGKILTHVVWRATLHAHIWLWPIRCGQ